MHVFYIIFDRFKIIILSIIQKNYFINITLKVQNGVADSRKPFYQFNKILICIELTKVLSRNRQSFSLTDQNIVKSNQIFI